MLDNALCILTTWVSNNVKADRPISFTHKQGEETYQIIVQRVPDQKKAVA